MFVLLILFIPFLLDSVEYVQTYNQTYFIDWASTTPPYNGTTVPWPNFDAINAVLSEGDVIYVRAGSYTFTSTYNTAYSGISGNEIRFVGDYTGIYWSAGTITINSPVGSPAFIVDEDYVTFENFTINGRSDNAFEITGNGVQVINCLINADDSGIVADYADYLTIDGCGFDVDDNAIDVNNADYLTVNDCDVYADDYSIFAEDCQELTISNCDLFKTAGSSLNIIYLDDCDDLMVTDCTTQLSGTATSCTSNIYIDECDDGIIWRNHVMATGFRGIHTISSTSMNFRNNAIHGNFSDYAFHDNESNNGGFNIDFNTINNSNGGGYYGKRYNGYNISSFRNNIIYVDESGAYTIHIDDDPDYWKPSTASKLDYNCFWDVIDGYVGRWNTTNCSTITNWRNATGGVSSNNSEEVNPNFYGSDWRLSSNSPDDCKINGCNISIIGGNTKDIDNGYRPPTTNISRGADQYNFAYFNPDATLDFGSNSSPLTKAVDITHYGLSNFQLVSIAIVGDSEFSCTAGPVYIDAGDVYALQVTFSPDALSPGNKSATLTITHNAVAPGAGNAQKQISLSGIAQ